mmetsp:Transcript_79431/g.125308  ORF Transcript_79431/g.125308 Transcript_79431/m.125308 type:complete len:217 (-) Transcript_79431:1651-2301(-)
MSLPAPTCSKSCSDVFVSLLMNPRISVTASVRFCSSSAYSFFAAFSLADFAAAVTFSSLATTRECRCLSLGTSLLSKSFKSSLAAQSSSTLVSFSMHSAKVFSTSSVAASAAAASSLILSAAILSVLLSGLALSSTSEAASSAFFKSSAPSSMIFCISALAKSLAFRFSSASARCFLASISDFAMATIARALSNFSNTTGSNVLITFASASSGTSN